MKENEGNEERRCALDQHRGEIRASEFSIGESRGGYYRGLDVIVTILCEGTVHGKTVCDWPTPKSNGANQMQ